MTQWVVVTLKGTFVVEAETSSRASQKTPGKTLSVEPAGTLLEEPVLLTLCCCRNARHPECAEHGVWVERDSDDTPRDQASQGARISLVGYPQSDPPSAKALIRHAKAHGPEGVQEIADAYGVVLPEDISALPSKRKPKKRPGVPRLVQARELLEQGHSWTVIEDTLDLPRSVSKDLRAKLASAGSYDA